MERNISEIIELNMDNASARRKIGVFGKKTNSEE